MLPLLLLFVVIRMTAIVITVMVRKLKIRSINTGNSWYFAIQTNTYIDYVTMGSDRCTLINKNEITKIRQT